MMNNHGVEIAASLHAAEVGRLGEQVEAAERAGAGIVSTRTLWMEISCPGLPEACRHQTLAKQRQVAGMKWRTPRLSQFEHRQQN